LDFSSSLNRDAAADGYKSLFAKTCQVADQKPINVFIDSKQENFDFECVESGSVFGTRRLSELSLGFLETKVPNLIDKTHH
jgi:hypothetical protein